MKDREHAEKRKREGRQGGAEGSPPRRDSRFSNDSDSASVEATPRKRPSPTATRMVTRSLEKTGAQRNNVIELSPSRASSTPDTQDRDTIQKAPTISDIMRHLLRMEEKEQESRTRAQEERARAQEERARAIEKENEYKNEIKQLQSTVTGLALDLRSLQESVPNWGSLQSSLVTGTTDSYASITARGVPLSEPEQAVTPSRTSASRVSFGPSEQSDRSPNGSPPISVGTSIRSAMKKTKMSLEADMVLDIKNLDTEGRTGTNLMTRTENRILAAIRSNEGLDKVVLNQFMIRHTNKDVHLAYFKINKEAEKVARAHVDEWVPMFLKGARLIESTWYPIKVDFVPKIEATDHQTGTISQETREAFSEENEVEVKLMRWLGKPKEYAAYASALVKLATKEQVEKLLQRQANGEEVYLFGCVVKVSPFHDNRGPRACYNCHQFGHRQRDCKNTTRCSWCAQEGHNICKMGEPKCCNCGENHPAAYRKCPEYRKQQEREINLRRHDWYTKHSSSKSAQEFGSSGCVVQRPRHLGLRCHSCTGTTLLGNCRKPSDHWSRTQFRSYKTKNITKRKSNTKSPIMHMDKPEQRIRTNLNE